MALSSISELERMASNYATKAVHLDRRGEHGTAITMYKRAIEVLLKLASLYPDHSLNEIYLRRVAAYKERIRKLQSGVGIPKEPNGPRGHGTSGTTAHAFTLTEKPNVRWSDVIGLDRVKRAIEE
ncbi:MAG: AAA family ATPase, partial [Thermoprotei archaeon]